MSTSFDAHKEELLKDPEFSREYEALRPKYDLIRTKLLRKAKPRTKSWSPDQAVSLMRKAGEG